ncbi:unnamed protein product [Dovyalis caffra]|uniref:Uncharacterized protein n=1 Tax=Dovyalis caffra TaxID=77055 RepID=A0AAV1RPA9_9ROSI|nr:unnamed protein product [Dovyalis caffra]
MELHAPPLSVSATADILHHIGFIKEVAATEPPKHLSHLLRMLKTKGSLLCLACNSWFVFGFCFLSLDKDWLGQCYLVAELLRPSFSKYVLKYLVVTNKVGRRGYSDALCGSIVPPGAKKGLIPLAIPLARNGSGALIALLRWPTAPPGMEMPVVEVCKHGVWLLAKTVDQYIHRILVEEDANIFSKSNADLFHAAADAGDNLYTKGDYAKSQILDLDVYLLRKVGLFPDVLERKVMHHLQKGDHVSALVTGEFYTNKKHFPGFARPFAFNAEVLLKFNVAQIAQWEDEQIEYIKEKMTEEGRQEDLNKGKEPAQIALDEAASLLDLASVEGTWDEAVEHIAECYKHAGLHNVARFVEYRD